MIGFYSFQLEIGLACPRDIGVLRQGKYKSSFRSYWCEYLYCRTLGMAKREGCVGWTRNMDWEVTEIQRTAEDVSCHYLYLRRTQPQPQTVFAQIQNTDLPLHNSYFSLDQQFHHPRRGHSCQAFTSNLSTIWCLHCCWNLSLERQKCKKI